MYLVSLVTALLNRISIETCTQADKHLIVLRSFQALIYAYSLSIALQCIPLLLRGASDPGYCS